MQELSRQHYFLQLLDLLSAPLALPLQLMLLCLVSGTCVYPFQQVLPFCLELICLQVQVLQHRKQQVVLLQRYRAAPIRCL